jgi:hypothetical protein
VHETWSKQVTRGVMAKAAPLLSDDNDDTPAGEARDAVASPLLLRVHDRVRQSVRPFQSAPTSLATAARARAPASLATAARARERSRRATVPLRGRDAPVVPDDDITTLLSSRAITTRFEIPLRELAQRGTIVKASMLLLCMAGKLVMGVFAPPPRDAVRAAPRARTVDDDGAPCQFWRAADAWRWF